MSTQNKTTPFPIRRVKSKQSNKTAWEFLLVMRLPSIYNAQSCTEAVRCRRGGPMHAAIAGCREGSLANRSYRYRTVLYQGEARVKTAISTAQ